MFWPFNRKKEVMPKTGLESALSKLKAEEVKTIVSELIEQVIDKCKKEAEAAVNEELDFETSKYCDIVVRKAWNTLQSSSKWLEGAPWLFPDNTRFYYRKGKTEVVVQEFAPQIRYLKFKGELVDSEKATCAYSLALPYVVFINKFVDGLYSECEIAFSDRPLKYLNEIPYRPYFSNLDHSLKLCEGIDFDRNELEKGNLTQQMAFVINHFWSTLFSRDSNAHFLANRQHFTATDIRLATLENWQKASIENPLFVIEDVSWLPHSQPTFGHMIIKLLDTDKVNTQLKGDLFDQVTKVFLESAKKVVQEKCNAIIGSIKVKPDLIAEQLAQKLNKVISK